MTLSAAIKSALRTRGRVWPGARHAGTARITLTAELVDPATRAVLARRTFGRTAPATCYDAHGAAHGFNEALGRLLDDIRHLGRRAGASDE